jgi:hypothetical protein
LTLFDPVTFPTAESAYLLFLAAIILANVSGREVPNATRVIPVTAYGIPRAHPNNIAASPTTMVIRPIIDRAIMNAGHPPPQCAGGTTAKTTFQVMVRK